MKNVDKKISIQKQLGLVRWLSWFVPLVIFVLTLVAFFPVLQNGFVNWDDDRNLLENLNYRGLGWSELRWMFTTFHMTLYRPLTWVSLGLDYLLWGMNPFGYHLTSLLLHAVNSVLFYFVCLRLLRLAMVSSAISGEFALRCAAGFAALLFSLHPLRVEPVAWASARNDVLSGLFFLGVIFCYLRASAIPERNRPRSGWITAAVIIYGLSLLSKATSMTLPIVLLVLDVYPLKRLGGGPKKWLGPEARRVWWEKVPFLLLAVGAGAIALLAKQRAIYSFEELGLLPRLAQSVFGLAFYLWKTAIPRGLSPLYQLSALPDPSDSLFWGGLVVLGISIVLFAARRRWPAGLASWVYYVVILVPVLGFAQSGPQIVADRYTYLSCLAWAILAGAGLIYCGQLWVSGAIRTRAFILAPGLAVALLSVFGVLTWKQTQVWYDSEKLWRHALTVDSRSSYAHNSLGNALFVRGEVGEAIEHYREALQIDPAYARAHNNIGNALVVRGEVGEAIEHFRQAVSIEPAYAKAHYNLGMTLARQGESEQAMGHFREALRSDPAYAKAHYNLGTVLAIRGELNEAIDHFRHALRVNPENAAVHEALGRALAQQGRRDEAMQHYQEALRILKSQRTSPLSTKGLSRGD